MSIKVFSSGIIIPTHDGKSIEEFIGNVSSKNSEYSVAHMIAPSGWSEAAHSTKFREIVIVVDGVLSVNSDGTNTNIKAGEIGLIEASQLVAFSNRENAVCEYWAICFPAFSPDLVEFR